MFEKAKTDRAIIDFRARRSDGSYKLEQKAVDIRRKGRPLWTAFSDDDAPDIANSLSPSVQMQFMRPAQLEAAA